MLDEFQSVQLQRAQMDRSLDNKGDQSVALTLEDSDHASKLFERTARRPDGGAGRGVFLQHREISLNLEPSER